MELAKAQQKENIGSSQADGNSQNTDLSDAKISRKVVDEELAEDFEDATTTTTLVTVT